MTNQTEEDLSINNSNRNTALYIINLPTIDIDFNDNNKICHDE